VTIGPCRRSHGRPLAPRAAAAVSLLGSVGRASGPHGRGVARLDRRRLGPLQEDARTRQEGHRGRQAQEDRHRRDRAQRRQHQDPQGAGASHRVIRRQGAQQADQPGRGRRVRRRRPG